MKLYILFGLVYLILAYKAPFSNRSLVPNLEPYPDTLYYSYPAWSWIHGNGFGMNFSGDSVPTIVPPAYSMWLTPFIGLFGDVRGFYFANIVLQIGTIGLFFASVRNIYKKSGASLLIAGFTGWMLVTNFYFYNLPSLLMSENLTIFCVALCLYLLVIPVKLERALLAGLLGVLVWFIKLSNLPLGLSFLLLYGIKIWKERGSKRLIRFVGLAVLLAIISYFGYFIDSVNSAPPDSEGFTAFSASYFVDNFLFYVRSIMGGGTRYLWFTNKFISPLFATLMLGGLILGLFQKEYRWVAIAAVAICIPQLFSTAFYYYPDARYIFFLLPVFIVLAGVPLSMVWRRSKQITWLVMGLLISAQLVIPLFNEQSHEPKIVSLKKQVGLNLKYREDPWNYNAMVHINSFLADKPNAYVGTFLPPFYVEMFKQGDYGYLPISPSQEFSGPNRPLIDDMYQDDGSIPLLYKRLIAEGKNVYITNTYVNNSSVWASDLEALKQEFDAEIVSTGCLGSCDIYQLSFGGDREN